MLDDFIGKIVYGDNLDFLKTVEDSSIDLIYIDPPFNTGKKQARTQIKTSKSQNGNRIGFMGNNYETKIIGTKEYEDDYGADYVDEFLRPRITEAYRVLSRNGSFYFHIDFREVHYCKILLDSIFGRECFLNEIIWAYDYGAKSKTRWPTKHDNILVYVKDINSYIFNSRLIDREPYMAPGLVGPEKAENGKLPTDTWWHTIVGTNSKERTGYPTQKPLGVIRRIIQASSLPNQIVLDFFAGSGTVGEGCLDLGRKFILVDNNLAALEVMDKRFAHVRNIEWVNYQPKKDHQFSFSNNKLQEDGQNHEFEMLSSMAIYYKNDIEELSELWVDSPFSWVIKLPPAKKGKLGRNLIASWFAVKGFSIDYPKDTRASILINGIRVSTKFSTLWAGGSYKFQQIRDENYDYLICLGISPQSAHCWIFNKNEIIERSTPQHKGSKGAEYWLTIDPENLPQWVNASGGSLDQAVYVMRKILKSIRKEFNSGEAQPRF